MTCYFIELYGVEASDKGAGKISLFTQIENAAFCILGSLFMGMIENGNNLRLKIFDKV